METENMEEELRRLGEIRIGSDWEINKPLRTNKPPPTPPEPVTPKEIYVDFEEYVQKNCENKLKILNRSTFHLIQRPIIIAFNHFREKCYYHTQWLDRLYQLSLKYNEQIEFIVADLIDMDFMYPQTNPITYFSCIVKQEHESPNVYAIDTKKRIHEHLDAYKTIESLSELCNRLLNGDLYPSQPIPEKSGSMVKICVHNNYNELVATSSKDILLIVGLGDYQINQEYEPNYEEIAKEVENINVDIVYIDGDKNYVPFEFFAFCYPTLLFIPHNDKDDFIHYYKGPRDTENVMAFIKENIGSQGAISRQREKTKLQFKPFSLPEGAELNFEDLSEYINDNFPESLKVLDGNKFNNPRKSTVIYFMDFKSNGISFYLETLILIHQVAQATYWYDLEYFIADIKDIAIMYPKWYCKHLFDLEIDTNVPHVFAIDRVKHIYKVDAFKTAASLFYYSFQLQYTGPFYSQPWSVSKNNSSELVKNCVAHNLEMTIKKSRTDVFLTIYWGSCERSVNILRALDEIAGDVRSMYVNMIKMDAKRNYVPLEYSYTSYPVHFFIPQKNKDEGTVRFTNPNADKEDILEFIRRNVRPNI